MRRGPSGFVDKQHSLRRQRQLPSQIQAAAAASFEECGRPAKRDPVAHGEAGRVQYHRVTRLVRVAVCDQLIRRGLAPAVLLHTTQAPAACACRQDQQAWVQSRTALFWRK